MPERVFPVCVLTLPISPFKKRKVLPQNDRGRERVNNNLIVCSAWEGVREPQAPWVNDAKEIATCCFVICCLARTPGSRSLKGESILPRRGLEVGTL